MKSLRSGIKLRILRRPKKAPRGRRLETDHAQDVRPALDEPAPVEPPPMVPVEPPRQGPRARREWMTSARLRRILLAALGVLVIAAFVTGHVVYWYQPRLRPALPRPGLLPAQLLAADAFPFAVWLPFPHQNLAVLEAATSRDAAPGDLAQALARLAGLPEPSLPSFGTLRLPPSREIVFAADESGERFAVAAEVYPAVAAFAKLAGRLADNRWLRGGVLTVEGRRVEVAWYGRVWTVASPGFPALDAVPPAPPGPASLMVAEVRRSSPTLPRGRIHLTREGRDLVLASSGAPAEGFGLDASELTDMGLFLLVVSGGREALEEPMQAMAFFARDEPLEFSRGSVSYEFPGMASIFETGGERWKLPGESLLKWTGRKVRRAELGSFSVAAIDKKSFRRIHKLAPRFAPLVRPRPQGRLAWGLWLDLGTGRIEIERIARAMEEIPFVPDRHQERWRDAATVLAPVAGDFSHLSVVVTDEPPSLRLRLLGRSR